MTKIASAEVAPGQVMPPASIRTTHPNVSVSISSGPATKVVVTPTQLRRPRRATIRTVFQALVALCAMAPVLVETTGLRPEQLPWLAGVLAVAALVTRVMAQPQVEAFLRRFAPWLAAAPSPRD